MAAAGSISTAGPGGWSGCGGGFGGNMKKLFDGWGIPYFMPDDDDEKAGSFENDFNLEDFKKLKEEFSRRHWQMENEKIDKEVEEILSRAWSKWG